jgi:hypothetical protein
MGSRQLIDVREIGHMRHMLSEMEETKKLSVHPVNRGEALILGGTKERLRPVRA